MMRGRCNDDFEIAMKMEDGDNKNGECELRIQTMAIVVMIADGKER